MGILTLFSPWEAPWWVYTLITPLGGTWWVYASPIHSWGIPWWVYTSYYTPLGTPWWIPSTLYMLSAAGTGVTLPDEEALGSNLGYSLGNVGKRPPSLLRCEG